MIETENLRIGAGYPCFIIAEIGLAHDGSLGMAHAYIDAVAKTGADAIKFQTHIAAEESTHEEPWRVEFSYQDKCRYDYWIRTGFSKDEWSGLKKHADEAGLIFLSSPFSTRAVRLLDEIGVPIWKVASGEVNSLFLLEEMVKTGKPIILSSGMSYLEELDKCAAYFSETGTQWALVECTTAYPTKPEQIDLRQMAAYRERYHCPVGLSDHSGTIYAGLAAAACGADIIEVHVCFSKEQFGPDVIASLTAGELENMIEGIRFIERMNKCPNDKKSRTDEMKELRNIFGKGMISRSDILKGEKLSPENVSFVKPAKGIPAAEWKAVNGKLASQDIKNGTFLTKEMITGFLED